MPIIIKDNIYYFGKNVSANSKMLQNYTAPYSATAVSKLEENGAIIIGKSTLVLYIDNCRMNLLWVL